jgi:hypothetical protein
MALLSEYAAAFAAPALALAVAIKEGRRPGPWLRLIAGGLGPALVFGAYHAVCFGSPFRIAVQSTNPMFLDAHRLQAAPIAAGSWLAPLGELVAGPSRGLLFTQPWLLLVSVAAPFLVSRRREDPAFLVSLVALPSLAMLLVAAASYAGGWHSGWSSGPRYLCVIFPVFALLAGLLLDGMPRLLHAAAWVGLVASVALGILALSTTILSPTFLPIWPTLVGRLFAKDADLARARFALAALAMLLAARRLTMRPGYAAAAARPS